MFIKRAAIQYNGEVFEGKDYSKISSLAHKLGYHDGVYGFVDSSDNFVSREEAAQIAKAAKQLPENYEGELYPEDIFGGVEYATN